MLRRPEQLLSAHHACTVKCNLPFYGCSLHSVDVISQCRSMQAELHAKAQVSLLPVLEIYTESEDAPIEIRSPTYMRDVCGGNRLQPDWLPDPGRAGIPDLMWLLQPVLLATRLRPVPRHILGAADKKLVLIWLESRCEG